MPLPMRRTALIASTLVALLPGVAAGPARAATFAATGERCTVVGTVGADVLTGTARDDVMCGRGGDDLIRAGAGDDVVDGGTGRDRALGGDGADRILGGTGNDRILGGAGNDRVTAGDGADHVEGDDGADAILGGDGADMLDGEAGPDTVSGGSDEDVVEGGTQGDDLTGNGGDDELASGRGSDEVDGGAGDNLCIIDAEDESIRCRYDEQAPVAVRTVINPDAVDVSHADAEVVVRVQATDDTGVSNVQVGLSDHDNGVAYGVGWLDLVTGTTRDGWWEGRVTVPRWTAPGPLYADVTVTDRQGRMVSVNDAALEVADENPDTEVPGVSVEQVTPAAVDVRTRARDVTVTVRAQDPKSGVKDLQICLSRPGTPGPYSPYPMFEGVACQPDPIRVSGTARDGVWTATLTIPKGSVGATYNLEVYAEDQVSNRASWIGPDVYQQWVAGRWCCTPHYPFPDDAGRVEVTGTVADRTPAWIDAVTASKTQLDTLADDDHTRVRVHALDAAGEGEGVTAVEALLVSGESWASDPQFARTTLELTSGTVTDGWWVGDVVAGQGTPPGTYHLLVGVSDRAHAEMYTDPTGPYANGITYYPLDGIPTITVVDSRP